MGNDKMKLKKTIWILVIIFILSLYLRLYRISELPYNQNGEFYDDLLLQEDVVKEIINEESIKPLYGDYVTNLYIFLVVPFYLIWNSSITLRIITAVIDSITLLILFFLVENVYDNKTALISISLYAISPFIINFSRLGVDINMLPFVTVFSLLFLFEWLKTKRIKYLYLLVFFLALGIMFHPSFTYITVAIFILLLINKSYKKINYKQFLVLILIFVIGLSLYFLEFSKGNLTTLDFILENMIVTSQEHNNLQILDNLRTRVMQSHLILIDAIFPLWLEFPFREVTIILFLLSCGFLISKHFYKKIKLNPDIILLIIFIFSIFFSIFSITKLSYAHLSYLIIIQIIIISSFISSILDKQKYLGITLFIILIVSYVYILQLYFNQYSGEEFGYKAVCKYLIETKPEFVITETYHTYVILSSCSNNSIATGYDISKVKNEIKNVSSIIYITDFKSENLNLTTKYNITFIKSIYTSDGDKIHDLYRLII